YSHHFSRKFIRLKTRIQVPLWLDIILFFSDRVSRFRHSLSNSSHISDSISRFPHSLSDSSHISDRISRFRHSLSDSSLISDRVSRSPHSMSDSSHISDRISRFPHSLSDSSHISDRVSRLRHSLSDLPHISDRTQRFPHSLSKSHLISDRTQRSSHSLSDSSSISQKLPRLLVHTAPKTSPPNTMLPPKTTCFPRRKQAMSNVTYFFISTYGAAPNPRSRISCRLCSIIIWIFMYHDRFSTYIFRSESIRKKEHPRISIIRK